MNIATISIERGSPGTESAYWVQALAAMYANWAERNGLEWWVRSNHSSASVTVKGAGSERLLAEHGHHRCVRVPPGDTRRHTVFMQVTVSLDSATLPPEHAGIIRSYTLDPYHLAKDHRTGRETEDVQAVLAGHLELLDALRPRPGE